MGYELCGQIDRLFERCADVEHTYNLVNRFLELDPDVSRTEVIDYALLIAERKLGVLTIEPEGLQSRMENPVEESKV